MYRLIIGCLIKAPITNVRTIRKQTSLNSATNVRDFELIDDNALLEGTLENKKPVTRRRASSKQLTGSGSNINSNYKSSEVLLT